MDVSNHTANAAAADFLERLIHDIREPLRSIGVFAELLKEMAGERLGEEGDHALAEIPAGAARIGILMEGLSGLAIALREPAETRFPASLQSAFTIILGELDDRIRACDATVTGTNLPRVGLSLEALCMLLERHG